MKCDEKGKKWLMKCDKCLKSATICSRFILEHIKEECNTPFPQIE